jgi:hypothetical protein
VGASFQRVGVGLRSFACGDLGAVGELLELGFRLGFEAGDVQRRVVGLRVELAGFGESCLHAFFPLGQLGGQGGFGGIELLLRSGMSFFTASPLAFAHTRPFGGRGGHLAVHFVAIVEVGEELVVLRCA